MMSLPEEGKEKVNVEADEEVEEASKDPDAASSCSQYASRRHSIGDVDYIVNAVEKCLQDKGLAVDPFLDMYSRVIRRLEALGPVHGFIGRDIYEQVHLVRMFRNGEDKEDFQTLESVLQGYHETNDQKWFFAQRALLRLIRGVPCVSGGFRLLRTIISGKRDDRMVAQAQELFNATLGRYLSEDVTKIINAVLSLFPTNDYIIQQMVGGDRAHLDHLLATIPALSDRLDHLFEAAQKLFAKYGKEPFGLGAVLGIVPKNNL